MTPTTPMAKTVAVGATTERGRLRLVCLSLLKLPILRLVEAMMEPLVRLNQVVPVLAVSPQCPKFSINCR